MERGICFCESFVLPCAGPSSVCRVPGRRATHWSARPRAGRARSYDRPCPAALTRRPGRARASPDFSDFLGRLQPSKTTIQRTPNTLGVEEPSSPRRVLLVLLVLLVPTTSTTSTTSTTRTTSSSSSTSIASTTCDLATLVMRDHGQCVPNRHPTLPKSSTCSTSR